MRSTRTERDLAGLALALGAKRVRGWSDPETALAGDTAAVPRIVVEAGRRQIERGRDPLGTGLCVIRTPEERRPQGATYTPRSIVMAMLRWAAATKRPITRVVDPGVGSARFLVAAGRRFKHASLLGIELDPLAALLARGHVAAAGLENRAEILVGDFRNFVPPAASGSTLWIGNPPYVRHHLIEPTWKEWLARTAAERGFDASQLAGLYVHFFLATICKAKPGDIGAFITAAEWLDVNYGRLVRELFLARSVAAPSRWSNPPHGRSRTRQPPPRSAVSTWVPSRSRSASGGLRHSMSSGISPAVAWSAASAWRAPTAGRLSRACSARRPTGSSNSVNCSGSTAAR